MRLVLIGPPGSGKGTQAKVLAARLDVPHISTGDIFRKNLSEGTQLGLLARGYMDKGLLVPDDVTGAMVKARLGETDALNGFILDGFPRTIVQGKMFDALLAEGGRQLDAVIYLLVARSVLVERLTGRRVCENCGRLYHVAWNPPRVRDVCDACGSVLVQRADDSEGTVVRRLAVYESETAPLVDYYRQQERVYEFNGELSADAVTDNILERLENSRG